MRNWLKGCRFMALLLLVAGTCSWCTGSGRVTLNCRNCVLKDVLKIISRQADVSFVFNDGLVQDKTVDCRFEDASVDEVLERILPGLCLAYRRTTPNVIVLYQSGIGSSGRESEIRGVVRDAENNEILPYANILLKGSGRGSASDEEGVFRLRIPSEACTLQVSYIGYHTEELLASASDNRELMQIVMTQRTLETREIEVMADRDPAVHIQTDDIGRIRFNPRSVQSLPSMSGADFQRVLQFMPGFSARTDRVSELCTPGGFSNQNLVYFDGIPVCSKPELYFGMLNPFHQRAIENVSSYQGGYPAQYGDCLSGIVELTGNTVPDRRLNFGFGGDIFQTHGFLEWPLARKVGVFASFNRSFDDITQGPLFQDFYSISQDVYTNAEVETNGTVTNDDYRFTRALLKLTCGLSEENRLGLTFYSGRETKNSRVPINTHKLLWGDWGLSMQWNRRWTSWYDSKLSCVHDLHDIRRRMATLYQIYNDSFDEVNVLENAEIEAILNRTIVKWDNTLAFRRIQLHAGMETLVESYRYETDGGLSDPVDGLEGVVHGIEVEDYEAKSLSRRQSFFAQGQFRVTDRIRAGAGFRAVGLIGEDTWMWLPRMTFEMPVIGPCILKGQWGKYTQFYSPYVLHQVQMTQKDSLVESSPAIADQLHLCMEIGNRGMLVQAGLYFKESKHMIFQFNKDDFNVNRFPVDNFLAEALYTQFEPIFIKNGRSGGLECLVQKKSGKLSGWLVYQYWISEFRVRDMNRIYPESWQNFAYPREIQKLHTLKSANFFHRGAWTLSVTGVYSRAGKEADFRYSQKEVAPESVVDLVDEMNYSSSKSMFLDYCRVDVGLSRKCLRLFGLQWELGISVINVLNLKNIEDRYQVAFVDEYNTSTTVYEKRMLPVTPFIFANISFR
ncbi:carboxypeptidase-like regulatory domain-containing protein [bacterium]|nr:carboxypeptidase-like regulatory domain-containing protein [bacterium]